MKGKFGIRISISNRKYIIVNTTSIGDITVTMKVTFKHVFVGGIHKLKVVNFRVMNKKDLPSEYTETDILPKCYVLDSCGKNALFIQEADGSKLVRSEAYFAGKIINLEEKDWIIAAMGAAGRRLYRINKKLNKERDQWEGKIEVVKF